MNTIQDYGFDYCTAWVYTWLCKSCEPVPPDKLAFKMTGIQKGRGKVQSHQGGSIARWFFCNQRELRYGLTALHPHLTGWYWPAHRDADRFLMFAGAHIDKAFFWRSIMMDRGAVWLDSIGNCSCMVPIAIDHQLQESVDVSQALYVVVTLLFTGGWRVESYTLELPYRGAARSIQLLAAQDPPTVSPFNPQQFTRRLVEYRDLLDDQATWAQMERSASTHHLSLSITSGTF